MKKVSILIILSFLIAHSLFFFPREAGAASEPKNCSIQGILPYQTAGEVCLFLQQGEAYPAYCGVPTLPAYQTCCCTFEHEYSCSWRKGEKTTEFDENEYGTVSVTGGCYSKEKEGTDCNPAAKPAVPGNDPITVYQCCCPKTEGYSKADFNIPNLQIKIDTVNLTDAKCTGEDHTGKCEIPWIAQYIQGVYTYGLGIGGILAAIVLMAGGVLWLVSAGDASKITQAKDYIIGSITGIIILMGTYFLLVQINPELTSLKAVSLNMIERVLLEADSEGQGSIALDMDGISKILGVDCNSVTVSEILTKAKGKVTYNNPDRGRTGPDNTVYNDCSGFANYVLKCALKKSAPSQTAEFFADQKLWDEKMESLQPGDLVGWAPRNSAKGYGHVFIYMGDGLFGDCHGGKEGREPGNCISNNLKASDIKASAGRHSGGKLYFKRY